MRTAISRKLVVGRRCANRAERSRSTDRILRMTEKILCRVRGLAGQGEIVLQQCLTILFPSLAPLILTHLLNFGHHDAHILDSLHRTHFLPFHVGYALAQLRAGLSVGVSDKKNSADADKPRDAFRGQTRSPNMLGMVSY